MKRINRDGPRMLSGLPRPPRLAPARATELLLQGALFIDTRAIGQFAAAHVPSVNIPLDRSFTTWAGWLVPYDRDFYVVVEPGCERCRDAVARDLRMIGLDRIAGYAVFDDELAAAWRAAGGTLMATPQMTVDDAAAALGRGDLHIVDVRWPSEWKAGHLPGVPNVPLGYLEERLHELPTPGTLVLHCQTGQRSSIAASLLHARGWSNVASLVGGFAAWQAAGYPITTATSPEPVNV
jgi:hydroxyacylglutathione hydrolase